MAIGNIEISMYRIMVNVLFLIMCYTAIAWSSDYWCFSSHANFSLLNDSRWKLAREMELHYLINNTSQIKGGHFEYVNSVDAIFEKYKSLEWWKEGGTFISVNDYDRKLSYTFGVNKNQDTLTSDTSVFKDIFNKPSYCLSFDNKNISFYNPTNREKVALPYKLLSQTTVDDVLVKSYQVECNRSIWEISVRDSVLNVKVGSDSILNVKNTSGIIATNVYNIYTHKKLDLKKAEELKKYKSSIFFKCKSFLKATGLNRE